MQTSTTWRQAFTDFVQDLQRAQGLPTDAVHDDPSKSLVFSLTHNDVRFEAIHFDTASAPSDRFLLQCSFGHVPPEHALDVLKTALIANQSLARTQSAMFALNKETHELVYSLFQPLQSIDTPSFIEGMDQLTQAAKAWRQAFPTKLH